MYSENEFEWYLINGPTTYQPLSRYQDYMTTNYLHDTQIHPRQILFCNYIRKIRWCFCIRHARDRNDEDLTRIHYRQYILGM